MATHQSLYIGIAYSRNADTSRLAQRSDKMNRVIIARLGYDRLNAVKMLRINSRLALRASRLCHHGVRFPGLGRVGLSIRQVSCHYGSLSSMWDKLAHIPPKVTISVTSPQIVDNCVIQFRPTPKRALETASSSGTRLAVSGGVMTDWTTGNPNGGEDMSPERTEYCAIYAEAEKHRATCQKDRNECEACIEFGWSLRDARETVERSEE